VQGLGALQRVERDVGAHDAQRVSLFEQQQTAYRLLQSVLAPRPPGPHQSLVFYTSQCSAVALGESVCCLLVLF